jgi:hypothetical protein
MNLRHFLQDKAKMTYNPSFAPTLPLPSHKGLLVFLAMSAFCLDLTAQSTFCEAVLSKKAVTLSGTMLIDSFDSTSTALSTGGRYDPAKRADHGDVASLSQGVTVITDTGNTKVYGHFLTTPTGGVSISGVASVGSLAWVNAGNRGIQPGWQINTFSATMNDATLPAVTFTTLTQNPGKVSGTNYSYVIGTGNYQSPSLSLSSATSVCINGNVVLYLPGGLQMSGQSFIYLTPGSHLTIYLGASSSLSGGGVINGTGLAKNVAIVGLPSCTSISYSGNSEFVGTIYAPEADISLTGGGATAMNFSGALAGNTVKISGNYQLHYDQALCGSTCATVISPPVSITNCPGTTATFSITVISDRATYQWYKNSVALAGQTNSTLILTNVSNASAGTYSVTVSASGCTSITAAATLTVNQPITISQGPSNATVCPGATVNFTVTATGAVLGYQWYKAGVVVSTKTNLVLASVTVADAGIYSVVVTGPCGSITNTALLTVNSPVLVSAGPADVSICAGSTAAFSVSATGTGLTYQWYKAATIMAGQTGATLTLMNVSAADAGLYRVVSSGACGTAVTNSATLTVNAAVTVANGPSSTNVCQGGTAVFSVSAGGASLTYQWYKGASPIAGQSGSVLTLSNVSANNAGVYQVVVSGGCGGSVTNSATLTVNQPVVIVKGPTDAAICGSGTVTFSVEATGTGLAYQWYHAGQILTGATVSTLAIANPTAQNAGIYSVVVRGTCGGSVTNTATLTINQPVVITTAPSNTTVCPGGTANFNIVASGTALTYQWYKGSLILTNQMGPSLSITNVTSADAGNYSVVVTGGCGAAITNSASLIVNQPVAITGNLSDQAACPGSTVTFSITATGSGLTYQWFDGNTLLAGQSGSSLVVSNVSALDAGSYSVVVHDNCGGALINNATLTINQNVSTVQGPSNVTVCAGSTATFSVSATGTGLSFQWFRGGNPIIGQTSSSLTLPAVSLSDAGQYQVVVGGACGAGSTNSATLSVNAGTAVAPLVSLFQNPGTTATFTAVVSGTGPFSYVWKKDGVVISGATGPVLTITNLVYANAGVYSVEVTGLCGTATQSATLGVNHPPIVTIVSPTNGAVFIAPANFTVLAEASDVDGTVTNVEFFLSGTNKIGESSTAPYFVLETNLGPGTYTFTAKATDNLGATGVSAPVRITVLERPPLQTIGGIVYSPQQDFFIQTNRVFNPTYSTLNAVRIYVYNLTNVPAITVHNASGYSNGIPYVETHQAIAPGSYVDIRIEYASPLRIVPNPILKAELVPVSNPGGPNIIGTMQHINRIVVLPNKSVLIEFASILNRVYYVQYSHDGVNWLTSTPALIGTGTFVQWIDSGEPNTDSPPSTDSMRMYRVILLP